MPSPRVQGQMLVVKPTTKLSRSKMQIDSTDSRMTFRKRPSSGEQGRNYHIFLNVCVQNADLVRFNVTSRDITL